MSVRIPTIDQPLAYGVWSISIGAPEMGHQHAFEYHHQDWDGAEDAFDVRCGYAASVEDAKRAIDDFEAEQVEQAARRHVTMETN